MRLIDADAAKNKVRKEMANADLDKTGFVICIGLINMFDDAGQLPTIEAEPVRHGRWVKRGDKWQCTYCKVLMNIDGTPEENLLNYCPNCGTKNDGKEEQK